MTKQKKTFRKISKVNENLKGCTLVAKKVNSTEK